MNNTALATPSVCPGRACINGDMPPALTQRDTRKRDDAEWREAAQSQAADNASTALEAARTVLVGLASHPSESGSGVGVTRYWMRGAVDYKKVPQLTGVDLDRFRKDARLEVRVSAD